MQALAFFSIVLYSIFWGALLTGMISATKLPDVLRVTFGIEPPSTDYTPATSMRDSQDHEYEVVCYVKICDNGIRIMYSHHVTHTRMSRLGHFDGQSTVRFGLTPGLKAIVQAGVMSELWSGMVRDVSEFPGSIDAMLETVKW